jgi:adenylyl-sulfate kinase
VYYSRVAGFTLWLTGLSGAGKSTLARRIQRWLVASHDCRVEILDGDEIRRNLGAGLGYSKEDRDANIRRIGFVADLLSRNGVVAIVAAISPYRATRDEIRRSHTARFVEVFVECGLEALIRRDPKGLYARALNGEIARFTGVSDPYEASAAPEVVVHTDRESVEESVDRVVSWLEDAGLVSRPGP